MDASASTGNGGRLFQNFVWSLSDYIGPFAPTGLYNFLEGQKSISIFIPESFLPANSSYVFSLSLTNWLGVTSKSSIWLNKPYGFSVPIFLSALPFQTVFRSSTIIIQASSKYSETTSSCNSTTVLGTPVFIYFCCW